MDYQELLALAKSTSHIGVLDPANATGEATNASCGDSCRVWLRIVDGKIDVMHYDAKGCVISRAAAAVLAAQGTRSIIEARALDGDAIRALLGVSISPLRERCLTTALAALQNALNSYEA
jgi:NifU-like protein involved in Fe-S cluster formation